VSSSETDIPGGDGPRDCGTFFLDVVGAFGPQDVTIEWSEERRATNEEVERLIDQAWELAVWQARKAGQNLFNGQLCRLIRYAAEADRLVLTLGRVSFKEFVGTNQTQANVRYLHGPEVLADPLGVSGTLRTQDGFLILGRRSHRVVQYAGRIHPIGGSVEPREAGAGAGGGLPDPFETILRELQEETAVAPEKVTDRTLLGLVRDKHTVQPELVFDISVAVDARDMYQIATMAEDTEEHSELVPVRDHPAGVVTFLEQHFNDLTPIGLASLLLHGLHHWGSGWFAAARGYLRSVI